MRALCLIAAGAVCLLAAGCGGGETTTVVAEPPAESTTSTTGGTGGSGGTDAPAVGDGEGGVELEELGSFEAPVYVTQPQSGDGEHLYVVEQGGTIKRVPLGGGEPTTFLDISELVTSGGEQGLLSVAFAPDYERSGLLYVNYTNLDGNSVTAEYRRSADDPAVADPGGAREVLLVEDFASNHNGGLLMFGPEGLHLGMGDGGGAGDPERTAQNPDSPLGKLLRLDPERAGKYELTALGLRNPWRYSFDSLTGDLWIGDVGQSSLEEIDAATQDEYRGSEPINFGWSAFEGTSPYNEDQEAPGAIDPVLEYGRDGGCSVTGGYVVRDPDLPTLRGRYLYGDYCEGELRSFTADPTAPATDDRALGVQVDELSSFGEDVDGNIYAVSLAGPVYRLVPSGE